MDIKLSNRCVDYDMDIEHTQINLLSVQKISFVTNSSHNANDEVCPTNK